MVRSSVPSEPMTAISGPSIRSVTRCPASGRPTLTCPPDRPAGPLPLTVRSTSITAPVPVGSGQGPPGRAPSAACRASSVTPSRDGRVLTRVPSSSTVQAGLIDPQGDHPPGQRRAEPDLLPADLQVPRWRHDPVGLDGAPGRRRTPAAARISQPAEPGGERLTERDRQRPRDMTGGKRGHRADINDERPIASQAADLTRPQAAEPGGFDAVDGGAAPVDLPQPQEIGRVAAQPAEQHLHESVLARRAEQQVPCLLGADGGGALRTSRRRAERPGSIRRVHGQVIGQGEDPLAQRALQRPGAIRSVRATAPTSNEPPENSATGRLPSRIRYDRCSGVCPGVPSARSVSPPRSTSSPSPSPRWGTRSRRPQRQGPGTMRGQLPAAGHEVRMQVGLRRIDHREALAPRGSRVRPGVTPGVDHQRPAVTEIDHVGGIAQALIDQGDRLCRCRHRSPQAPRQRDGPVQIILMFYGLLGNKR